MADEVRVPRCRDSVQGRTCLSAYVRYKLLLQGHGRGILSKLLGHADVNITYNIYVHLYGDGFEEMYEALVGKQKTQTLSNLRFWQGQ